MEEYFMGGEAGCEGGEMRRPTWVKTYNGIVGRCNHKNSRYFKKGIKCLITKEELKQLWFRDKAHKMDKPSIDRINVKGDYELKNCRYIELAENARLGNIGRKATRKQIESAKRNLIRVNTENIRYRRKVSNGIKIFQSLSNAAKYYDICVSAIVACCQGKAKKCNGMRWKYEN